MAAMEKREHRFPSAAHFFQSAADSKVAARGNQSFFEHSNRFLRPSRGMIDLRKVQVQLSVVVTDGNRFLAKSFRVRESFFGQRREQAGVGQVKRILWCDSESPPRVQ